MNRLSKIHMRHFPIYMITIIMPFITYMHKMDIPDYVNDILHYSSGKLDFLTYYKGVFIVLMGLIMVFIIMIDLIVNIENRDHIVMILKKPINISVSVLFLLVTVSYFKSDYKSVSLLGEYITGEGTLHWLAYLVTFVYTQVYFDLSKFDSFGKGLMASVVIFFVVGLLGYSGLSIFENSLFLEWVTPTTVKLKELNDIYSKRFSSFFGNPNHIGSYIALVFPVFLTYPFKWENNNKLYLMPLLLLWAMLIFSQSSAGLLGVLVSLGIWLTFIHKNIEFVKEKHGVLLVSMIIVFALVSYITGNNSITSEISQLKNISSENVTSSNLSNITLKNNQVNFNFGKDIFSVTRDQKSVKILWNGEEVELVPQESKAKEGFVFKNEVLSRFKIYVVAPNVIEVNFDDIVFYIENRKAGFELKNMYGENVDLTQPPSYGFRDFERFASSRGYIWSRTFPMLKETLLIGKGADTYALHFPQNDILGKLKAFNKYNHNVDKPHNIYLYIFFSYGGIALLIFVSIIIQSMKKMLKTHSKKIFALGLPVLGISVVWLFNDSMVYYAPVFWFLLGCLQLSNDVDTDQ